MSSIAIRVVNVLAVLAVFVVNGLSNYTTRSGTNPWGGVPIGKVSDAYPTPLTPAGYTFAIWGVIYTGLAVYAVAQCIYPDTFALLTPANAWVDRFLFLVAAVFNIAWVVCFTRAVTPAGKLRTGYVLASLVLLVLLVIALYTFTSKLMTAIHAPNTPLPVTAMNHDVGEMLTHAFANRVLSGVLVATFVLYCAWTTIASVLNVWSAALDGTQPPWSADVTQVAIATLIVLGTAWCVFVPTVHVPVFPLLSALVYAAVFVWAAVGIGVKATGGVRITAYVMAAVVAVVSVGVIVGRR